MEVCKEAAVTAAGTPDAGALSKINRQTKTPLTAEEVYSFTLRLCDDQPDRDFECFAAEALPKLAELFVGKTGIADHNWSAESQTARIYDAEVVMEGGVSFIRASAYMLRCEKNRDLIAEIEGGIRREVSVGCAMGLSICSICGCSYGDCQHCKGETYDGETCVVILDEPVDAYEFSFVAVPAQKDAGVLKAAKGKGDAVLWDLVLQSGTRRQKQEYRALADEAAMGRRYLSALRQEVVRLGLILDLGLGEPDLRTVTAALSDGELIRIRDAWQKKAAKLFPAVTQLPGEKQYDPGSGSAFLV